MWTLKSITEYFLYKLTEIGAICPLLFVFRNRKKLLCTWRETKSYYLLGRVSICFKQPILLTLTLTNIREQGLLAKLGILLPLNHPPTMCQLIAKCSTVVAYISFRTDYQRARISCLTTVSTPTYSWACDTLVTAVMMFMWCAARHGILFIFDESFPTILDQAKCRIMIPITSWNCKPSC